MTKIHIPVVAMPDFDAPATNRQIAHMRDLGWPLLDQREHVTIGQAAAFINHAYHALRWSEAPA